MYSPVALEKDTRMHPIPSRRSRLSRTLASCAAIAVLASGIGLTTGAAAHAELLRSGPVAGQFEGPVATPTETLDAISEPASEEQESPEVPEPTPSVPDEGEETSVVPADTEAPGEPDRSEVTPPAEEAVESPAPAPEPVPNGAPEAITNGSSKQAATTIGLGQTVTGSAKSYYSPTYYRLRAPSDGRVNFSLTFPTSVSGEAFQVELESDVANNEYEYRFNGGDAQGKSSAIPAAFLPAGDFFVIVRPLSESTRNVQYTLNVTHSQVSQVEREPNNSRSQANFITAGKTIHGSSDSYYNPDFFVMNTPQAGTGQIQFTFPNRLSGKTYLLNIYDAGGTEIDEFELFGSDADGRALAQRSIRFPKGQIFVEVRGYEPAKGQPYALTLGMKVTASTPTISGNTSLGSTLTAQPGKWGPGTMKFAYQWNRDGKAIPKATGASYKVTQADVGRALTVTVTGLPRGRRIGEPHLREEGHPDNVPRRGPQPQVLQRDPVDVRHKAHHGHPHFEGPRISAQVRGDPGGDGRVLVPTGSEEGVRPAEEVPFRDVPTNHKFYKEIAWMYEQGISTGSKTSAGREYRPKSGVSREAMAAFLFRLRAPVTAPKPKTAPFADVGTGHKFAREIAWMKSSKLSTGSKIGGRIVYQPGTTVSREAMAAFLYRMDRSVPPKPTTPTTPKPPTTKPPTTKPPTTKPPVSKTLSAAVPSISGNGRPGHTLTAHTGTWGPAPVNLSTQWLLNGSPIAGATGQHYTVRLGDGRQNISVKVTGSKSGYTTANRTSGTVWVAPDLGDKLVSGQTLPNNFYLQSNNGKYRLVMQTDGNLVMYNGGTVLWRSNTAGAGSGATVTMQGDGNLVVHAGGTPRWSSKTNGKTGAYLVVQDDSNLVIYVGGRAVWDRITKG